MPKKKGLFGLRRPLGFTPIRDISKSKSESVTIDLRKVTSIPAEYGYMVSVADKHYFAKNEPDAKELREVLKERGYEKVYIQKIR